MQHEIPKESEKATLISQLAGLEDYSRPMKLCPDCKSISSDTDTTCGVCGHDLSHVPYESREEVEQTESAAARAGERLEREWTRRIRRKLILRLGIGSLVGVCLILVGIYMIQQAAQVGEFGGLVLGSWIVWIGMVLILVVFGWSLLRPVVRRPWPLS